MERLLLLLLPSFQGTVPYHEDKRVDSEPCLDSPWFRNKGPWAAPQNCLWVLKFCGGCQPDDFPSIVLDTLRMPFAMKGLVIKNCIHVVVV